MISPLTGPKVFALFALGFGTIIAVNVTLAVNAVRTFPGLEVANSYVASQTFDADRAAQQALGWEVAAHLDGEGVTLSVTGRDGAPVAPATATAILGRATEAADDRKLDFRAQGDRLVAEAPGLTGRWLLRLTLTAEDGTLWRRSIPLVVGKGAA